MKAQRIRSVRGKKIYGYVKRRPSAKGVLSVMVFVFALLCLFLLTSISYNRGGEAGARIGAFGLMTLMLSVFGMTLARLGFHESNRSYTVAKVGLVLNSLLSAFLVILFIMGLVS